MVKFCVWEISRRLASRSGVTREEKKNSTQGDFRRSLTSETGAFDFDRVVKLGGGCEEGETPLMQLAECLCTRGGVREYECLFTFYPNDTCVCSPRHRPSLRGRRRLSLLCGVSGKKSLRIERGLLWSSMFTFPRGNERTGIVEWM